MITAEQVHNVRFRRAFRGYAINVVDQLLEDIEQQLQEDADTAADLTQKNDKLKQVNLEKQSQVVQLQTQIDQLQAQVEQMEKELNENAKRSAEQRSELEASLRAEITREKQSQIDSLQKKVDELEQELAAARKAAEVKAAPPVQPVPDVNSMSQSDIRREIDQLTEKVANIEKRLGISQEQPKKVTCKPQKVSKIRLVNG